MLLARPCFCWAISPTVTFSLPTFAAASLLPASFPLLGSLSETTLVTPQPTRLTTIKIPKTRSTAFLVFSIRLKNFNIFLKYLFIEDLNYIVILDKPRLYQGKRQK